MIKLTRPECPNKRALENGNYKHSDNKDCLRSASDGKCMYCESSVPTTGHGEIEHIKPKSKFPESEFEWENLGYVCQKCNSEKSDKFDADTPLLNPYDEDPKEHIIASGAMLLQKTGSERGQKTINEIDLNRPALLEKRYEKINCIQQLVAVFYRIPDENLKESTLEFLKTMANKDKEYSLCMETLLQAHKII